MTELITPKAYSLKIGKSRQWVYELIKAGKLKTRTISGVIFVVTKKETTRTKTEND